MNQDINPDIYLIHDILELHDGDPYEPVFPTKAVILDTNMELVGR